MIIMNSQISDIQYRYVGKEKGRWWADEVWAVTYPDGSQTVAYRAGPLTYWMFGGPLFSGVAYVAKGVDRLKNFVRTVRSR